MVITRSACNDKRQEFTQLLHSKPESVCGSHFASRLRQVWWARCAQGPKIVATPQVCRCYTLVTNVRVWYGIALKVLLVCVRRSCFCSVYRLYVASNTHLTWNDQLFARSLCVCVCVCVCVQCMFVMSCIFMYVYITQAVLRQVLSLCQSQFFTECGIVLLLPISRIRSFPEVPPVAAYIFYLVFPSLLSIPLFFPSITCFRRQFLHKMWPIQWAFLIFIVCRMYRCSLTDCHTSSFLTDRSNWSSPSFSSTTFHNFPGISDALSAVSSSSTTQSYDPNVALYWFLP